MEQSFLNIFLDPKDLLNQPKLEINPFLLENNSKQIEKIYNFYKNSANFLYINGFLGTGKADIVNYSTSFLSDDVITLKYNCFNSTVLDDILLVFFKIFKKLSSLNIISEPKIKTENFTQKINSYFAQIEKPFLIILDSFEAILEENRQEIVDFIHHLASMKKVKVIIIGRSFDSKLFQTLNVERITTLAFEFELFEKYLRTEKIKASNAAIDEFYKHTRGYYLFTTLSINLMKNKNYSLNDFLTKLKDSFLPFNKFLGKEAILLVPDSEKNLFFFLSMLRHPVTIEFLEKINLGDCENLNKLINNNIIIKEDENIYIQDYLRDSIEENAPAAAIQKIRQLIIELYENQLPLKPLDRGITISRQTMRKEIEFQKLFLPKKYKIGEVQNADINYLTYAKSFKINDASKKDEEIQDKKSAYNGIDLTQRKKVSLNLENLSLLENEKTSAKNTSNHSIVNNKNDIKTIIELIKDAEIQYNYSEIIELCLLALELKSDKNYKASLPLLYSKLAFAYNKTAKTEKALKYYEILNEIYSQKKDFAKFYSIKYKIANIYYETYKADKSKSLFLEIINSSDAPKILIIKSILKLASIEEESASTQQALEYYNQAFKYTDLISDNSVLSELYFKYALILDDKNDTKKAIDYYKKSIDTESNPDLNKFLSSAYSNIATLFIEENESDKAIMNYTKAFETDEQNKNYEGAYDAALKIAGLIQRKQPQKAIEFLNSAIINAEKSKDIFYIISANLALGDFYYDLSKDEFAIKYYIKAHNLALNNLSRDNIYKIEVRLNDIKFRMGEEKFNTLFEELNTLERKNNG